MESERRQFWRKLVQEYQQGGTSFRAVAIKHGVNPSTLNWWSRQFRKELELASETSVQGFLELSALVPMSASAPALATPDAQAGLGAPSQTIRSVEADTRLVHAIPGYAFSGIELQVSTHLLRLGLNFDAATLGRALDVLEARR
jgi:transposase-like protein